MKDITIEAATELMTNWMRGLKKGNQGRKPTVPQVSSQTTEKVYRVHRGLAFTTPSISQDLELRTTNVEASTRETCEAIQLNEPI